MIYEYTFLTPGTVDQPGAITTTLEPLGHIAIGNSLLLTGGSYNSPHQVHAVIKHIEVSLFSPDPSQPPQDIVRVLVFSIERSRGEALKDLA